MTYTTYSQILGWANASVFFTIMGGVGYSLWQLISPWYIWLPVFFVVTVIIGQVGHRLIPRLVNLFIMIWTSGKVENDVEDLLCALHVDGQYYLGSKYYGGYGVVQDDEKAARWFRRAAEGGHWSAQYKLGRMYHLGRGVPQDYAEATRWYRLAAEHINSRHHSFLGERYGQSHGVPQDEIQAYRWIRQAAKREGEEAPKKRAMLKQRMTPAQIAEVRRLSVEWTTKLRHRASRSRVWYSPF